MRVRKPMSLLFLILGLLAFFPENAWAGQTARTINNSSTAGLSFSDSVNGRNRQMFFNSFDYMTSVSVLIGGWGSATSDFVTLKIGHACGGGSGWQYWGGVSVDLQHKTAPYWVTITLPTNFGVNYGEYYVMEVSAQYAQIGTNLDGYNYGSMQRPNSVPDTMYPNKKRDVVFIMNGTADSAKLAQPEPTTNIACSSRCYVVGSKANPNVENTSGGAKNYLNILVHQWNSTGSFNPATAGSLWGADINQIKTELRDAFEGNGTAAYPGLKGKAPWDTWFAANKINVYVAIENPADDPNIDRGGFYCANIDLAIDLVYSLTADAPANNGQGFAAFLTNHGTATGWGLGHADVDNGLRHELFGHGFGLADEYGSGSALVVAATRGAGAGGWYRPGDAPIGCADLTSANWCTSYKNVTALKTDMFNNSDPYYFCWGRPNTLAGCETDDDTSRAGTQSACVYMPAHYATVPNYYGTNVCVPKTVVYYNIGTSCAANTGCYIGSDSGVAGSFLDVAQANGRTMAGFHACDPHEAPTGFCSNRSYSSPINDGYSGGTSSGVQSELAKIAQCLFATSCASSDYDVSSCRALVNKWGGGAGANPNNSKYLAAGLACDVVAGPNETKIRVSRRR